MEVAIMMIFCVVWFSGMNDFWPEDEDEVVKACVERK